MPHLQWGFRYSSIKFGTVPNFHGHGVRWSLAFGKSIYVDSNLTCWFVRNLFSAGGVSKYTCCLQKWIHHLPRLEQRFSHSFRNIGWLVPLDLWDSVFCLPELRRTFLLSLPCTRDSPQYLFLLLEALRSVLCVIILVFVGIYLGSPWHRFLQVHGVETHYHPCSLEYRCGQLSNALSLV